jgi:hypothetical protein
VQVIFAKKKLSTAFFPKTTHAQCQLFFTIGPRAEPPPPPSPTAIAELRRHLQPPPPAHHLQPLCAHAASLGHLPALRELGHCLQDGYGARRDDAAGLRLLLHATAWELLPSSRHGFSDVEDAASRFMVEWWAQPAGKEEAPTAGGRNGGQDANLRLCSQVRCGRRETRWHEFWRVRGCGAAIYCSRAC